ncbi:MAG: VCBS repeat-containing protein [Bacteroidetes bacterium]|nr:VCBS repeat-containing protein [Bacteroidota bacterium]
MKQLRKSLLGFLIVLSFQAVGQNLQLLRTHPAANRINVSRTAELSFKFNMAVDDNSLHTKNLVVWGEQSGYVDGKIAGGGTDSIRFQPYKSFFPGELVYVTLRSNIKANSSSDTLNKGYNYLFQVMANPIGDTIKTFTEKKLRTDADGANYVFGVDFDLDGDVDILGTESDDDEVFLMTNDGSGNFTTASLSVSSTYFNEISAVFPGDFDKDGDVDFAAVSWASNSLVLIENVNGSYSETVLHTNLRNAMAIYGGDIDSDGDIDLFTASAGDNKLMMFLNMGGNKFKDSLISTACRGIRSVFVCDIDGDYDNDLITASQDDDKISAFINFNTYFKEDTISTAIDGARWVRAADMTGNGLLDIIATDRYSNGFSLLAQGLGFNFTTTNISGSAKWGISAYPLDFDGDWWPDVVGASRDDDKIWFFEQFTNGSKRFYNRVISTTGDRNISVFPADFNGDGFADLLSCSRDDNEITLHVTNAVAPPTNELAINAAGDSMRVAWTSNTQGTKGYYIEFDTAGFLPGNGRRHAYSSIPAISAWLTGLHPDSNYSCYMAEITYNGDTTAWSEELRVYSSQSSCDLPLSVSLRNEEIVANFRVTQAAGDSLGINVNFDSLGLIIQRSYANEIAIYLQSPSGKIVDVSSNNTYYGNNYGDPNNCAKNSALASFSNNGLYDITVHRGAFGSTIGSFRPEESFQKFADASNPNGIWKLFIRNGANRPTTLLYAKLSFSGIAVPENLAIKQAQGDSIQFNWESVRGIPAKWYEVKYDTLGFSVESIGNNLLVGDTHTTISWPYKHNLQVYVRAISRFDTSAWSNPITVYGDETPCMAEPIVPNGAATGDTLEIPFWVKSAGGDSLGVNVSLDFVEFIIDKPYVNELEIGLVSPSGKESKLAYRQSYYGGPYGDPASCPNVTAHFSSNGTYDITKYRSAFTRMAGSFRPQEAFTLLEDSTNPNGIWKLRIYNAGGWPGTFNFGKIGFETCTEPENLQVLSGMADSLLVAWQPAKSLSTSQFELRHGELGFNPATEGQSKMANDSFATIKGLSTQKHYDVYVRNRCKAEKGKWLGPLSVFASAKTCGDPLELLNYGEASGDTLLVPIRVHNAGGDSMGVNVVLQSVDVIINQSEVGNLALYLQAPNGNQIALSEFRGGYGSNYGNPNNCPKGFTRFSKFASTPIASGRAPYIGEFIAETPITAFEDSGNANGVWKLKVYKKSLNSGQLVYANLNFSRCVSNLCPEIVTSHVSIYQDTVNYDDSFTISYVVENIGKETAFGPWEDRMYLSRNEILQSHDSLLAVHYTDSLPSGKSDTITVRVHGPRKPDGYQYVLVMADANRVVPDVAINNFAVSQDSIYLFDSLPKPDLVVTKIETPVTAISGESININYTIKNIGNAATPSIWMEHIHAFGDTSKLLDTNALDPNWLVAKRFAPTILEPGEEYTFRETVQLPEIYSGAMYYMLSTNANKQFKEWEQDFPNNARISKIVRVIQRPMPDYTLIEFNAPEKDFAETPTSFTYRVKNIGTGDPTATDFDSGYKVYISDNDDVEFSTDGSLIEAGEGSGTWIAKDSTELLAGSIKTPFCTSGFYYVYLLLDKYNKMNELDEGNNFFLADSIEFVLQPKPDLVPTEITLMSPSPESGEEVVLSYKVKNDGFSPSAVGGYGHKDGIYLSRRDSFDASAAQIDWKSSSPWGTEKDSLKPNEVYSQAPAIQINDSLHGSFYLYLVTDLANDVCETPGEGNNKLRAQDSIYIKRRTESDLVVSQLNHQANVVAGDALVIDAEVWNNAPGATRVSSWEDHIYLVKKGQKVDANNALAFVYRQGILAGDSIYKATGKVLQVPLYYEAGEYELVYKIDVGNEVYEYQAENNNEYRSAINVSRDPSRVPDVLVNKITYLNTPVEGDSLYVQVDIKNASKTLPKFMPRSNALHLTNSNSKDRVLGVVKPDTMMLNKNQVKPDTFKLFLPYGYTGKHELRILLDSTQELVEYNLANNEYTEEFNISPASDFIDYKITQLQYPKTVYAGQAMAFAVKTQNVGAKNARIYTSNAYYLSSDSFLSENDVLLGRSWLNDSMPSGMEITDSLSFEIPLNFNGDYYLLAVADADNWQFEGKAGEQNNLWVSKSIVRVLQPKPVDLIGLANSFKMERAGVKVFFKNTWSDYDSTYRISLNVLNSSFNPAYGSWQNNVYLSKDKVFDKNDIPVANIAANVARNSNKYDTLDANQQVTISGLVNVEDGRHLFITPGYYHIVVEVNSSLNLPEFNYANNLVISTDSFYYDPTTELELDSTHERSFSQAYKNSAYRFNRPKDKGFILTVDGKQLQALEAYHRVGDMPNKQVYDTKHERQGYAKHELLIPVEDQAVTDYLYVNQSHKWYKEYRVNGKLRIYPWEYPYTIRAEQAEFGIHKVFPLEGGNDGIVTLRIDGFDFDEETEFYLVKGTDTIKTVAKLVYSSIGAETHFNLSNRGTGNYSIIAKNTHNKTVYNDSFQIRDKTYTKLRINMIAPSIVRGDNDITFKTEFSNGGNTNAYDNLVLVAVRTIQGQLDNLDFIYVGSSSDEMFVHSDSISVTHGAQDIIRIGDTLFFAVYVPNIPSKTDGDLTFNIRRKDNSKDMTVELACQLITPNRRISGFVGSFETINMQYLQYVMKSLEIKNSLKLNSTESFKTSPWCQQLEAETDKILYEHIYKNIEVAKKAVGMKIDSRDFVKEIKDIWNDEYAVYRWDLLFHACLDDKTPLLDPLVDVPKKVTKKVVSWARSIDPNEIVGPAGETPLRLITTDDELHYTIYFENLPGATASANQVRITNPLPAQFRLQDFQLLSCGFDDTTFQLNGDYTLNTTYQLGSKHHNMLLNLTAGIDVLRNEAFWIFTTIDPTTGRAPTDPLKGFLLPNDSTSRGEGFVTYRIKLKPNTKAGDVVQNQASIIFDTEAAIKTNVWTNPVASKAKPESAVNALPDTVVTNSFTVSWQPNYLDSLGYTITDYDIYYAVDSQNYVPWLRNVSLTEAIFTGEVGHSYQFYSIANYSDGTREIRPVGYDAGTYILDSTSVAIVQPYIAELHSIQVYPNPFEQHLQVLLQLNKSSNVQVQVFDISGQVVHRQQLGQLSKGFHQRSLGVSHLKSGMYLLQITTNSGVQILKLEKQQ